MNGRAAIAAASSPCGATAGADCGGVGTAVCCAWLGAGDGAGTVRSEVCGVAGTGARVEEGAAVVGRWATGAVWGSAGAGDGATGVETTGLAAEGGVLLRSRVGVAGCRADAGAGVGDGTGFSAGGVRGAAAGAACAGADVGGADVAGANGGPLFRSRVKSDADRWLCDVACPDRRAAARAMTNMAGPLRGAGGTARARSGVRQVHPEGRAVAGA